MKSHKSLEQSLLNELRGLIRREEDEFAPLVLDDLTEALAREHNQLKVLLQWRDLYYRVVS